MVITNQTLRGNCNCLNANKKSIEVKEILGANTVSPCEHTVKIVTYAVLQCKALLRSLGGFKFSQ